MKRNQDYRNFSNKRGRAEGFDGVAEPPAPALDDVIESFPVAPLDRYKVACARFQEPTEIGYYSYDHERKLKIMDDSELKYYVPPDLSTCHLSTGYPDRYVARPSAIENLDALIECLDASNKDKVANGSPEVHPKFVTWRGIMTKIFCTPYAQDAWELRATFFNDTIYIMEYETPERRQQSFGGSDREKLMAYWGYRFESLSTLSKPPDEVDGSGDPELKERLENGIVNTNIQFCSVFKTKLGNNEIVMGAEVDCIVSDTRQSATTRQKYYGELKTNRVVETANQQRSFEKFKLLRVYFQSWLAGIRHVVVGYRDDNGWVTSLETLKTLEIPRKVRGKEYAWDPIICINFACMLLDRLVANIKGEGREQDKKVVYGIRYVPRRNAVEICKGVPDSPEAFLPF
ncbi:Dom-3 Z [Phlyctochytrium planicorne]|nr:Dom-3 Z [Phlyctochytrium planicorne]